MFLSTSTPHHVFTYKICRTHIFFLFCVNGILFKEKKMGYATSSLSLNKIFSFIYKLWIFIFFCPSPSIGIHIIQPLKHNINVANDSPKLLLFWFSVCFRVGWMIYLTEGSLMPISNITHYRCIDNSFLYYLIRKIEKLC